MQQLNRKNLSISKRLPIKIVQFGEGNFLRAFVEFAIQTLNSEVDFNAGIAVVQPIEKGLVSMLNQQDGLYTLFTKGLENGVEVEEKELITNIVTGINPYLNFSDFMALAREPELEFVISNTTEAGISFIEKDEFSSTPPSSFPAKLTKLLYERFTYFNGSHQKGLAIIPCELINHNADTLKKIVLEYISLWKLSSEFKDWVLDSCTFHNTLVDRIVPGYPKDQIAEYNAQLDYHDDLIVSAETFFLWVIEGDEKLKKKLPFHKTNLDVKIVKNMQPFRTRKVRILNGAHTAMVPFSILFGNDTVKETIDDNFTGAFIQSLVFDEIIATLDMEQDELYDFANDVFDRFRNPFIKHQLASIALNSISKFKVRVLPSLLKYIEIKGALPNKIVFAFACLIRFYKGDFNGNRLPVNDDENIVLEMVLIWKSRSLHEVVAKILGKEDYWGQDLNSIENLGNAITNYIKFIEEFGIEEGFLQSIQQ
ncbi:tagaturonate reductase [Maribacter sp. SA7]|uniref:tagaturonate reductase n=1 Tax=Maribacter zhoushanensis TaxID=3030012 RepID=UPI0023ED2721|nr:tagaturonate reductase [Maribacter zhoushanensis]MDF4202305.1 tagaturonate reductase [Maribacter zhoushanensis]